MIRTPHTLRFTLHALPLTLHSLHFTPYALHFTPVNQTDQFSVKCEDQPPFSLVMYGIFVKIWKSKVKGVSYESDIRYAGQ